MDNEIQLIKKAKAGDVHAFEALIQEHQSIVYNVAYKMFPNHEDASDIAQEALIKAYRYIGKFEGKSKFSTWIYKITYNVCIDELRKRKKLETQSLDETFTDSDDAKYTPVDTSPTPEQSLESKEKAEVIYKAIDSLAPDYRAAIILRDINGLSYEEIATVQSCSIGTVKSRINRGRKQLQEIISQYLEQTDGFSRHRY